MKTLAETASYIFDTNLHCPEHLCSFELFNIPLLGLVSHSRVFFYVNHCETDLNYCELLLHGLPICLKGGHHLQKYENCKKNATMCKM